MEMAMPANWNTICQHLVVHIGLTIQRYGPFHSNSMLWGERWHTRFKKCVHNVQLMLASVAVHYRSLEVTEDMDTAGAFKDDPEGINDPWYL